MRMTRATYDKLRETLAQHNADWLAMLKAVAQLSDVMGLDEADWGLAGDDILLEQFDPWVVLRTAVTKMEQLPEDGRNGALPLEVSEYVLERNEDGVRVVTLNSIPYPGGVRWGIYTHDGFVLSKNDCLFFVECPPSSRDDDYYEDFRWETAEEACAFWVKNLHRIPATAAERREWWRKKQDAQS
jgi:hypothetical protein